MDHVPCMFTDNISLNPPNNLLRQMWFLSILQMRKLRIRKIQPLCPQPLSLDLQTVWFQSLCFFLPPQSVLKREQVWFWWKQPWICPSAFRACGGIPGDKHLGKWEHWRYTRLPSCLLCSRANCVLHALVSGHPHFVRPWPSLPQQSETPGPSWYPTSLPWQLDKQEQSWEKSSSYLPVNNIIVELIFLLISIWFWSCQKEGGKFDPDIAFFCSETYKIFPGFIYLSHFPGGIFHGKQRMNRLL